jgi:hypothetical protein
MMAKFRPLDPVNRNSANSSEQQMNIELFEGNAGDLTSREAGNMVKRMVQYAEQQLKNGKRI